MELFRVIFVRCFVQSFLVKKIADCLQKASSQFSFFSAKNIPPF